MLILHQFLKELKSEFAVSRKGEERGTWFVYTLLAIIVPLTSSKTSNLLRCLRALFGFSGIQKKRYYTFMASSLAKPLENDSGTFDGRKTDCSTC